MANQNSVESNSNLEKKTGTSLAKKLFLLATATGLILCVALLLSLNSVTGDVKKSHIEKREVRKSTAAGKLSLLEVILNFFKINDFTENTGPSRVRESCSDFCDSPTCHEEASFFLKNMNPSVDPCDDFYEFACGNFIKNAIIPDDENKIDLLRITQNKVMSELIDEIRRDIQPDELDAFKKMKIQYQNCMNEDVIEAEGVKTLLETLSDVGGWPVLLGDRWNETEFDWQESVYKITSKGYVIPLPATIFVGPDSKDTSKNVLKVLNADTQITQSFFFIDGSNSTALRAYYDYMVDIAVMLNADRDDAIRDMKKCLDFEINLYRIKSSMEELMDTTANYNPITIRTLEAKHPSISWLTLFNKIINPSNVSVTEDEVVILSDPKFLTKLEHLLARTPKRVIANYLLWHMVYDSIDYMPSPYLDRQLIFFRALRGVKERKSKSYTCVDDVMITFPLSLSALYVRKYFDRGFRQGVLDLVHNVKSEFRKMLVEVDWMDHRTRLAALEKLDAMDVFVAYSDELFDDQKINDYYKDLEINRGSYLKGAFNISHFFTTQHYGTLRQPVDKQDWTSHKNAAVVNAYYYIQKNTFEIPAGFLRGSFYKKKRPNYLNYGAIGSIIGHEITHGFDNEGRKTDKNGNQVDWWQARTKEKYLQKAKCIVNQYSEVIVPELGIKLNGERTQGENIADNGGFKAAYRAYQESYRSRNVSEKCLPGLNYTTSQMFWISAANNWCSKQRVAVLRAAVTTDSHSLPMARVDVSFSNIKEFSEDFNCKLGTRMNPVKKCVVW